MSAEVLASPLQPITALDRNRSKAVRARTLGTRSPRNRTLFAILGGWLDLPHSVRLPKAGIDDNFLAIFWGQQESNCRFATRPTSPLPSDLQVAARALFNALIPLERSACCDPHPAVREEAVATTGRLEARRWSRQSGCCDPLSQCSECEPQREPERATVVERVRDPSEVGFREVRAGILELRVIREIERLGPEQQGVVTA